jgi:hypothetical protein
VCPVNASGHSGQPPLGDPPFTRNPARIPNDVLSDFVAEQAKLRTYRVLAREWGLAAETLRKFAEGITKDPHKRQLELYGSKFLELHPSGYVQEKPVDGHARALPQFKNKLPAERERAQEIVDLVFELAARHPDELPNEATWMREWLSKVLNAEFDAEAGQPRRRRRKD